MSDDLRLQDARRRSARRTVDKAMREKVAHQADEVAALLKIAPEEVLYDKDGLQLTPRQGEQLLSLARASHSATSTASVVLVYDGCIAESDVVAVCADHETALAWVKEHPDMVFYVHSKRFSLDNPRIRVMEVVQR